MKVIISNEITVIDPSSAVMEFAEQNLIFRNPDYSKKKRMGLWTGSTPEFLYMYRTDGNSIIFPCGAGKQLFPLVKDAEMIIDLADNGKIEYCTNIPLYDYQELAVDGMRKYGVGILKSPCGSGKTQMGIALAGKLSLKTLWVTHTQDLLTQSYERAAQYYDKQMLGVITAGKVHVGSHMTFATVQTLSKLDLAQYKYTWDTIIVDECHRLAGTPSSVTMFSKVMNSLAARYKFGLSATVHRSDGLIGTTFAIIGNVAYTVPDEAVKEKTMQVTVIERSTGVETCPAILDTDGTLSYQKLIAHLVENRDRNRQIADDLIKNSGQSNLILSDRLDHLRSIMDLLPIEYRAKAAMIDGKMTSNNGKARRAAAIERMRTGELNYLFASYSLAKEGLDIPRLNRLYLAMPKKDYAVVTQSIGRIARVFDGKTDALCYDYVDNIQFCENQFRKRKLSYKKAGCRLC